jgi:hypothetical protein
MLTPVPCPECGYDLRGAAEGRCPECGFAYDHEAVASVYREAVEVRELNNSDMIDYAVLIAALLLPGDLVRVFSGQQNLPSLLIIGHGIHLGYALKRFGIMDPDDPRRSWWLMLRPLFLLLCMGVAAMMITMPGLTRFVAAVVLARMWQQFTLYSQSGFERPAHEPQPEGPLQLHSPLSRGLLYGTSAWFMISFLAWLGG